MIIRAVYKGIIVSKPITQLWLIFLTVNNDKNQ